MERVASHLKGMGLTVCPDLLVRSAGKEQKKLDRRAREENSRAVFRCTGKRTCKSIVLLDDVRTTGASLRAASAAIEAKGSQVKAWIVFAID
jgi:predicted amidophosphoribosyltransferase